MILTARDNVADTVAGLDGGADDYVTKPFRFDELLARVRVRLRGMSTTPPRRQVLCVADSELDLRTRCARVGDRDVELSAREFALAELFFRHPGQVLSREQIAQQRLGLRLRPGVEHRGRVRRLPAQEARAGVDLRPSRRMGYRLEKSPPEGPADSR